jgi:hypothetical protein
LRTRLTPRSAAQADIKIPQIIAYTIESSENIRESSLKNLVIICNEEGKLRGLQPNVVLGRDMLVGTIIVCGASGDEFSDIPIDFKKWEQIVNMSGTDTWKEFER